jgi:Cu/Zn superoxide dismutase
VDRTCHTLAGHGLHSHASPSCYPGRMSKKAWATVAGVGHMGAQVSQLTRLPMGKELSGPWPLV